MQDRVSLYPGRVKLEPVAGQANTYDLTRADQPTQEGTPLNKASLLKDTTAALFGLNGAAVPDDVLKAIGGLPIPVSSGGTGATSLSAFAEVLAPVLGVGKNRFTTLKTYNAPNTDYYEATVSLSGINWASWDKVHIDLYSTNGQQGLMTIVGTNGEELNALGYFSGYQRRVTLFPGYNASRYVCAFNGTIGVTTSDEMTYSQLSSLVFTNATSAKITIIGEP